MEVLMQRVSASESRISDSESKIKALEQRLSTAEQNIADLKKSVADIQQKGSLSRARIAYLLRESSQTWSKVNDLQIAVIRHFREQFVCELGPYYKSVVTFKSSFVRNPALVTVDNEKEIFFPVSYFYHGRDFRSGTILAKRGDGFYLACGYKSVDFNLPKHN